MNECLMEFGVLVSQLRMRDKEGERKKKREGKKEQKNERKRKKEERKIHLYNSLRQMHFLG